MRRMRGVGLVLVYKGRGLVILGVGVVVRGPHHAIGAGIAAILAFFAGCTVPSAINRAVPESWHWPEQRAANLLSRDMWSAGAHLMQVADPESWRALSRLSDLYRENEKAIDACYEKAQRRKNTVPCSIEIGSPDGRV